MTDYTQFINVRQGTNSDMRYSNGNTLPLTAAPFGMNHFSIQTKASGGGWFYHPNDKQVEGVRLTHRPSPWIKDYGHFVIMPQNGDVYSTEEERTSGYSPEDIILKPHFMQIFYRRYQAMFQLVPTERCSYMKIEWEKVKTARFAFLPFAFQTKVEIDAENKCLYGYTKAAPERAAKEFAIYFYFKFNQNINIDNTFLTFPDGKKEQRTEGEGVGIGANIAFELSAKESLEIKMGTSFISMERAKENLAREIGNQSFEETKEKTLIEWNDLLGRIQIEAEKEEKETFYSCMYRCFLFPRIFYEKNALGENEHYAVGTGEIKNGIMYTDNGFWDTYRTIYPLFTLLIPQRLREMIQGFLNFYLEEGWLPKWISVGELGIMPGTLIDAVLTDAAAKGILTKQEMELALEGMLKHATKASGNSLNGRMGVEEYQQLGYIPMDKYTESVNNTLDAAYCDFCIAQLAGQLGKKDVEIRYRERAQNYKKLYDSKTGFLRGRYTDGNFAAIFSPFSWGGEYCEGSAWQNAFSVFHDIEGVGGINGR